MKYKIIFAFAVKTLNEIEYKKSITLAVNSLTQAHTLFYGSSFVDSMRSNSNTYSASTTYTILVHRSYSDKCVPLWLNSDGRLKSNARTTVQTEQLTHQQQPEPFYLWNEIILCFAMRHPYSWNKSRYGLGKNEIEGDFEKERKRWKKNSHMYFVILNN